jgi:UDP-N-acetylglucosamine--N-acetylmuramyl-(pentapeptide) pyrophosphoryl-undecaprenol N-acetylglucosamine transferase
MKIKKQTVVYVGGGSGGHVAPLLAVHKEFIKLKPEAKFFLITDKKALSLAQKLFKNNKEVKLKVISSGKFRRHSNLKFSDKLRLSPYYFKNLFDLFKLGFGLIQSLILTLKLKPSVIISKGGYVAVPAVYAAKLFGAKIIIHDSDTRPGLASKLTASKADRIFTGFDTDFYPKNKTEWIGVPIDEASFSKQEVAEFGAQSKLNTKLKTILVLGGGNGSENLNEIIQLNLPGLLNKYNVIHQAGKGKEVKFNSSKYSGRYVQFGFCSQTEMFKYLKLSDLVISRAGATSIQELAYNKKPSIIIPSPYLSDQIKNIKFLEKKKAALSLDELNLIDDPSALIPQVEKAFADANTLSLNIAKIYKPGAAKKMAEAAASLL